MFGRHGWLAPVALTLAFCLNGIWWGTFEIWNADQMAFKDHFREGAMPFSPKHFDKPPLFSYINFVFSVAPREVLVRSASLVTGQDYDGRLDFISVWLAKLLQLLFAAASVYFLWRIAVNVSEDAIARLTALLLATSAGFVVQAHLITTDLPVVFFMILAFWASQRIHLYGRTRDYVLAGVLIGLTGAIKYNGLVIGLALPVFHVFATARRGLATSIFDRRLYFGLASVPLGFIAGNPYAAVEFRRFAGDLQYLFATSPHFIGASGESTREASILASLAMDHVGWPLFLILTFAIPFSIWRIARDPRSRVAATVVASALIAGLYILYFSRRTNLQVRWVLVIVPLLLVAAIPFWGALRRSMPKVYQPIAALLIAYGALCSMVVGLRFSLDPRFEAIEWMREHVPAGSSIESSVYTPRWQLHVKKDLHIEPMPGISGRHRIYARVFDGRPVVLAGLSTREQRDDVDWFSVAELHGRRPDYVVLSSIFFERFLEGEVAESYPELQEYFRQLLNGQASYEIVFDRYCCRLGGLLYPRDLLFVDNRQVILRRIN